MPFRSCVVYRAEKSPDLLLQYCARCQSALYCSEACQRIDWSKQHKKICKLLNVGHGDMQFRTPTHTRRSISYKERFESLEHRLDEDIKRFFKLFEESTFERSQAAARKMRKIAERQNEHNQGLLLFHSLSFLVRSSDSEMLSWPNSPLLVLLQSVDLSVLCGDNDAQLQEGGTKATPLHRLGNLVAPFDYSTHENQLILAKQLVERGANVNAITSPQGGTPLHNACNSCNVTNLDFVKLLLEEGADPNFQDPLGFTPLMCTISGAPGAAKFLLNWPTTDVNFTTRSGASFLALVRMTVENCSDQVALPDIPDQVQQQVLLQ
jgi:hypothetical protein